MRLNGDPLATLSVGYFLFCILLTRQTEKMPCFPKKKTNLASNARNVYNRVVYLCSFRRIQTHSQTPRSLALCYCDILKVIKQFIKREHTQRIHTETMNILRISHSRHSSNSVERRISNTVYTRPHERTHTFITISILNKLKQFTRESVW